MVKINEKRILGSCDKIDFPNLGLENISCKIDTGADTSSIDCHHVRTTEIDGEKVLVFRLLEPMHQSYINKDFTSKIFKKKNVRNSFGDKETRYFVNLKVILFNRVIETEFSLSDRSDMNYPVLLGKKLLYQNFIVDVSQRNLSFSAKEK